MRPSKKYLDRESAIGAEAGRTREMYLAMIDAERYISQPGIFGSRHVAKILTVITRGIVRN